VFLGVSEVRWKGQGEKRSGDHAGGERTENFVALVVLEVCHPYCVVRDSKCNMCLSVRQTQLS
jgi:hypothetical protein